VFLFSSLFIIQGFCVCVCGAGSHFVQDTMVVYPRGNYGNTACHLFAHLLVCWMSPRQVWSWHLVAWEPSYFFSVTWHREALYRLGVQGVKTLIFLGVFFSQVWLQHFTKIFDLWSSCCGLLHSSPDLGSSSYFSFNFL
jgi:hypothetical protein